MSQLSIKVISEEFIPQLASYWIDSSADHLANMGVEPGNLPTLEAFSQMLETQLALPIEARMTYGVIWCFENKPIGHCNVSPFYFGDHAFLHLHLWNSNVRKKGIGTELVPKSMEMFFDVLKLNKIYSQPYALNDAPNRTLAKIGFELEEELIIIPGSYSFEQPVKRWVMTKDRFIELFGNLQE